MPVVDSSIWQEFIIGDLFEVKTSRTYAVRELEEITVGDEETINYVVRTKFNNGIKYRVHNTNELVVCPAGTISFGAENSVFFYQDEDYVVGRDVAYVDTQHLSRKVCLFLTAVLNTLTNRYSYDWGMFPSLVVRETISLPVRESGEPDWAYMEQYVEDLAFQSEKRMEKLTAPQPASEKLDISQWCSFRIEELFYRPTLKFIAGRKLNRPLDLSEFRDAEFDLPLVNAKLGNNGIMYYGRAHEWDSISNSICVVQNGASSVGSVYYHAEPTGVLGDAYLIRPFAGDLPMGTMQFLTAILHAAIKPRFSYDDKATWERVKLVEIKLPAKADRQPEWDYMESYIANVQNSVEQRMETVDDS